MIGEVLVEREGRAVSNQAPHLSYSRINRYLHCPEQYRLYYVENLRAKFPSAALGFGQILHLALAALFRAGSDPVILFLKAWDDLKGAKLTFAQRESWEKLRAVGQGLLEKFVQKELPRLGRIDSVEKGFAFGITSLDLPFIGYIDLVADMEDTRTLVDFKTSASCYEDHEAALSDQLTVYQLAEPDAKQAALCVLVKTKEPNIQWHFTNREGGRLIEFLTKAEIVAQGITAGHFYKRPGKWCSWCDYLPVCLGDTAKIKGTLVQIG